VKQTTKAIIKREAFLFVGFAVSCMSFFVIVSTDLERILRGLLGQTGLIIIAITLLIVCALYPLYAIIAIIIFIKKSPKSIQKFLAHITTKEFLIRLVLGLMVVYLALLISSKFYKMFIYHPIYSKF